jgi:aerobic C4-dicarboxylate transport protein
VARHPSAQVLVAIVLGVAVGALRPAWGAALRPVSDTFINLVKMIVTPVIFLTIVIGIAGAGSLRRVGRVGIKALVYFEVVSTASLVIGLAVVNLTRPGAGLDPSRLPHGDVSRYVDGAQQGSLIDILTHIVPSSIVGAFATGDVLQVVFVAIVFGVALAAAGESGRPVVALIQSLERVFFRLVALIMLVAPVGAFGAMAYTVATFGLDALRPLLRVMADVYLTMAVFVFGVLGVIARLAGFRLLRYLAHIKDEILLVLGTSSSEAALPGIMEKLVTFGCARPVVGLVIPAGYSFNLDGTFDLSRDGRRLSGPGIRGAHDAWAAAGDPRGADADVQGCRGCDRVRVHRACLDAWQHARHSRRRAGSPPRDRPLHVRGAGDREPHWEWRGDHRRGSERGRISPLVVTSRRLGSRIRMMPRRRTAGLLLMLATLQLALAPAVYACVAHRSPAGACHDAMSHGAPSQLASPAASWSPEHASHRAHHTEVCCAAAGACRVELVPASVPSLVSLVSRATPPGASSGGPAARRAAPDSPPPKV